MSKKTLKFNNIRLNKKEFHNSKEPIDLMSVIVDQIVVSNKFKHDDEDFKYFIVYLEDGIVKPFYLKRVGIYNTLKMVVKTCLF